MRKLILSVFTMISIGSTAYGSPFSDLPSDDMKFIEFNGTFIVPNEPAFASFADSARDKTGALISVGTFRTLIVASYGRFSDVILFDVDKKVVEFNQLQIEALRESATVGSFLSALLGRKIGAATLDEALRGDRAASAELHNYVFNAKRFAHDTISRKSIEYVESLVKLASRDHGAGFLTSPTAYRRLRQLAIDGRMHSLHGNLAGEHTLKAIGSRLKQDGVRVSVVDVSNAPYYIFGPMTDEASRTRFGENLRSLPWAANGIVNFTSELSMYPRALNHESWFYYSVPRAEYLAVAERMVSNRSAETEFARSLRGSGADMNFGSCRAMFRWASGYPN